VFQFFTKNSANFKGLLFLLGLLIIVGTLWYTQQLVDTLKTKSTEYVRFRVKIFEASINNPNEDLDVGFFFNEVIRGADYPIIITDAQRRPQSWQNISEAIDAKNDLKEFSAEDSVFFFNYLDQIASENEPIAIKYQGTVLSYKYYGFPPEIYKLKKLPYIAIVIGIVFILFAYLGFTYIKRSEQRNIWVGMAKETAHQLGTPLSSLSGWLELIKIDANQKDMAISEMNNDLHRLNKIANRFSKIGSVPNLIPEKIQPVIKNVATYYQRRLPNINNLVNIKFPDESNLCAYLNIDLFEWVLENLIKNAIDAIHNKEGLIELTLEEDSLRGQIYIDIKDNGKGIQLAQKKNIFKPGFSTKKRGWGLGLSLAKRIIEEYHDGRLLLLESKLGEGSTFRIGLKKA